MRSPNYPPCAQVSKLFYNEIEPMKHFRKVSSSNILNLHIYLWRCIAWLLSPLMPPYMNPQVSSAHHVHCACKLSCFNPLMLVHNPIPSACYLQVGAMAHGKIDKEYTDDYIQSKWHLVGTIKCCMLKIWIWGIFYFPAFAMDWLLITSILYWLTCTCSQW